MATMKLRSLLFIAAALPMLRITNSKLRIGITDWNLKQTVQPEAVPIAARLGFDGVQVSCGRRLVGDKMPLDNPETIAQYLKLAAENRIAIDGTCVDRLHDNGLK